MSIIVYIMLRYQFMSTRLNSRLSYLLGYVQDMRPYADGATSTLVPGKLRMAMLKR